MFAGLRVLRYKQRFGFPGGEDGVLTGAACARVARELNAAVFPRHLRALAASLGDADWVAGTDTPTIADFCLAPAVAWLREGCFTDGVSTELLAPFPRVAAWLARFEALEGVRAWHARVAAKKKEEEEAAAAAAAGGGGGGSS